MFDIIYRYDSTRGPHPLPEDANEACRRLEQGNQSFASWGAGGKAAGSRIIYMDSEDVGVPLQHPFAVVLGCSDARVPTEMIFERTANELFVVRVAGNIISQELLGSIDYALEHLGKNLKLLVVLGHSQCGAVTAAVDAFLKPAEYLGLSTSHHLRSIINILFPSVRGAVRTLSVGRGEDVSQLSGYRQALIESAVIINAALMASILKSEFGDAEQQRRVVFGVYDLASRRVHVPVAPEVESAPAICLMDAPVGQEEFRKFAFDVARSAFMDRLLRAESV